MCQGFMTHFKGVKLGHSYNLVVNLCYKHIFLDIFFGRAWQTLNFSGLYFFTKRQLSAFTLYRPRQASYGFGWLNTKENIK